MLNLWSAHVAGLTPKATPGCELATNIDFFHLGKSCDKYYMGYVNYYLSYLGEKSQY